ncbi:MAG: hypothetical protein V7K48_34110 [Nostoc sp.]|uniref:hypothetical protein n=1 Tax=Nostoc sp. TaxID=1180 RepID=UPI002FF6CAB3
MQLKQFSLISPVVESDIAEPYKQLSQQRQLNKRCLLYQTQGDRVYTQTNSNEERKQACAMAQAPTLGDRICWSV